MQAEKSKLPDFSAAFFLFQIAEKSI